MHTSLSSKSADRFPVTKNYRKMVARKPRVVIVGAGMAGLSAAYQLQRASCAETSTFDIKLLEASQRIGGRICSSQFGDDKVELGATWIHGIDGSPLYDIAERIDALKGEPHWEREDGFPEKPILRAEGGLIVDDSILEPVVDAYKKIMLNVRDRGAAAYVEKSLGNRSVGAFLKEEFDSFLSQQTNLLDIERPILSRKRKDSLLAAGQKQSECAGWSLRSLQDAVFAMQQHMERILTAVNSLYDLDLESEKEYEEYPGEHVTIGKGYASVANELASWLLPGTLQLGKKVQKLVWNFSHPSSGGSVVVHCHDGSVIEADHVIVTVSLGVLKAGTETKLGKPVSAVFDDFERCPEEDRRVCKSVLDLGVSSETPFGQLFEPPLPLWKADAISRLGFGVVDKLFLLVDPAAKERFHSHMQFIYQKERSNKSGIPWWMRKTFSLCPIYKDSSVLLCWFAGEEALEMERLSDDEIITGVVDTLARFGLPQEASEKNGVEVDRNYDRGESSDSEESSGDGETGRQSGNDRLVDDYLRSMFRGVLRSSWGRNPLFYGSYSYVAVGSSGLDIETLAQPLPGAAEIGRDGSPPLQLLFAGEATDRNFYSTTHGAYLSGLREANRLLHHYGLSYLEPV